MFDDNDGEDFFGGDDLTFEDTMWQMEKLAEIFRMSGKIEFFIDPEVLDEDGRGIPSFKFYPDTTFGFVF